MTKPKIGVMGAGAIGCFVGGMLATSGTSAPIVLVGRERIAGDIAANGLHVGDLDGSRRTVPRERYVFDTDPSRLAECDVVLCSVKSAATASAADTLARVLRPGTLVVSLQNGVRNADVLRERLDAVLAGIVNFNVLTKREGLFRRATSGALFIERSSDGRATELVQALRAAGLDVEQPPDIRGAQWAKLLFNLNNAISALSGRPTRELVLTSGYRRVLAG